MNMKFADAFSNSVSHIEVYVYDTETGALLFKQEECGEKLSAEDYVMELKGLAPGSYDIAVWGGDGLCKEKFILDAPETGHYMTDVICTMQREEGNVKEDVGSLFYGMKRVTFEGTYGTHQETIYLTKNTNTIRVVLQHLSGIDVNPDEFTFKITDENGVVRFAFISRIMKEKGIDYYLAAAKAIRKKYPNAEFHVCGFCEAEYEGKLNEYNDNGTVIYHGMIRDVADFLEHIHCVIHPTYYPEGLSNVLLEASASGRPIITTDRSGCREVIDDGANGYMIPCQNGKELIKAIDRFMQLSNDDRRKMGLAGRQKVEKEFDRQIVVHVYMEEVEMKS